MKKIILLCLLFVGCAVHCPPTYVVVNNSYRPCPPSYTHVTPAIVPEPTRKVIKKVKVVRQVRRISYPYEVTR